MTPYHEAFRDSPFYHALAFSVVGDWLKWCRDANNRVVVVSAAVSLYNSVCGMEEAEFHVLYFVCDWKQQRVIHSDLIVGDLSEC